MTPLFALNQATVPNLSYEQFLDLAARLDCVGVEPRNDLERPLFDGLSPAEAGRLAKERGLELIGINQVFPFDAGGRAQIGAVEALAGIAREAGAAHISLIPSIEDPIPDDPTRYFEELLGPILPVLRAAGVVGLVEPLGLSAGTLKDTRVLESVFAALEAGPSLRIVHDTFQRTLGTRFAPLPHLTALVQISGISDPDARFDDELDGYRGLVEPGDRSGAVEQMRAFLAEAPEMPFSFECTSAELHALEDPEPALRRSMDYIRERLGATAAN